MTWIRCHASRRFYLINKTLRGFKNIINIINIINKCFNYIFQRLSSKSTSIMIKNLITLLINYLASKCSGEFAHFVRRTTFTALLSAAVACVAESDAQLAGSARQNSASPTKVTNVVRIMVHSLRKTNDLFASAFLVSQHHDHDHVSSSPLCISWQPNNKQ